jgi:hypothetical protein
MVGAVGIEPKTFGSKELISPYQTKFFGIRSAIEAGRIWSNAMATRKRESWRLSGMPVSRWTLPVDKRIRTATP